MGSLIVPFALALSFAASSRLVPGFAFVKVDATHRIALKARVEEPLWVLQPSSVGEREPDSLLERPTHANYALIGSYSDPIGLDGFFHFSSTTL